MAKKSRSEKPQSSKNIRTPIEPTTKKSATTKKISKTKAKSTARSTVVRKNQTVKPILKYRVIAGQLRCDENLFDVEGLRIEAWDTQTCEPLGSAITDEQGVFKISISRLLPVVDTTKWLSKLTMRVYANRQQLSEITHSISVDPRSRTLRAQIVVSGGAFQAPEMPADTKKPIHFLTGVLLEKGTRRPLGRLRVDAIDIDDKKQPLELGYGFTNTDGVFIIHYTDDRARLDITPHEGENKRHLQFRITTPDRDDIHQIESMVDPRERVTLLLPEQSLTDQEPFQVKNISDEIHLNISPKLLKTLEKHGLHNLAELDEKMKPDLLKELTARDHRTLEILHAHANLRLLSKNTKRNAELIKIGYTNVSAIADTPVWKFISDAKKIFTVKEAAAMHLYAGTLERARDNELLALKANQANSRFIHAFYSPAGGGVEDADVCRPCDAANSPSAYLSDLLYYAEQHLSSDPNPTVDPATLASYLHQPFLDLVVPCEYTETKVRQMRLLVEVLRGYSKQPSPLNQDVYSDALDRYLATAYHTLLHKIGMSYDELRLTLTGSTAQREVLTARLGINVSHLDAFLIAPHDLTEEKLEHLFGLIDTCRDPLSTGAALGAGAGVLKRWMLNGTYWNRNTDSDGQVYLTLTKLSSDHYRIDIYRDSGRQQIVAHGESIGSWEIVIIAEDNKSGLSGRIELASKSTTRSDLYIKLLPDYLCWRLQGLRDQWANADWPNEPYYERRLPVVDPHILDSRDFRNLAHRSHQLWHMRRDECNAFRTQLHDSHQQHKTQYPEQSVEYLFRFGFYGSPLSPQPLPPLEQYYTDLTEGNNVPAVQSSLENLHLTVEMFLQLMTLKHKHDRGVELTVSEENEAYDIFTGVYKRGRFLSWIQQEQADNIVLGPQDFWITNNPPTLVKWLASVEERQRWQHALQIRSQRPVIDPDLIEEGNITARIDISAHGSQALSLWIHRRNWLHLKCNAIVATGNDLDQLLQVHIGSSINEIRQLKLQRDEGTDIALRLEQLSLSIAAFEYLLRIDQLTQQGLLVQAEEWEEVQDIILQAIKQRQYAAWRDQEQVDGITLSPDYFIHTATPTDNLRPWRASHSDWWEWSERLNSRIAQHDAALKSIENAVDSAEESALPLLRDGLVESIAFKWGGSGSESGLFDNPSGIAISPNGRVYITDEYNHRVQVFDNNGQFLTMWGEHGSGAGQFNRPGGIAVDLVGNIYVTDTYNHRVQKFTAEGVFLLQWVGDGTQEGKFRYPRGIAVHTGGQVYVTSNHEVQMFNMSGFPMTKWGSYGTAPGQFRWPTGIAVDSYGDVYVVDYAGCRIEKFDSTGTLLEIYGRSGSGDGQFRYPVSIAVAPSGDMFITDTYNYRIQQLDNSGDFVTKWGSRGFNDTQFATSPRSVACDSDGNIYTTEAHPTNRVQMFCSNQHDLKAEWIARNLLIDAKCAPCTKMTRLGQAIETVQATVRAAYERKVQAGGLSLVNTGQFDQEWTWIGKYGNWRSAMFVHMHPELALYPTLKQPDRLSPGFYGLTESIRTSQRINQAYIDQALETYTMYINDVSSLQIKATAWVMIDSELRLLLLALSPQHMRVYWSLYDSNDSTGFAQTYWYLLAELEDVLDICGAIPHGASHNGLDLFVKVWDREAAQPVTGGPRAKLLTVRFETESRSWNEPNQLMLPQDGGWTWELIVNKKSEGFGNEVIVAVRTYSSGGGTFNMHRGMLQSDGSDWIAPPAYFMGYTHGGDTMTLHDLTNGILIYQKDQVFECRKLFYSGKPIIFRSSVTEHFVGAFTHDRNLFIFTYSENVNQIRYRHIAYWESINVDTGLGLQHISASKRSLWWSNYWEYSPFIIPGGPQPADSPPAHQVCWWDFAGQFTTKLLVDDATLTVEEQNSARVRIAPLWSVAIPISYGYSSQELQARRQDIALVWDENAANGLNRNLNYVEEAHFSVPLLLAARLTTAHQYSAALQWYRTVYDYNAPSSLRKIFAGLEREYTSGVVSDSQRYSDWFVDPLNPHAIAPTRPGAYSRFTILSLIRCLLAYADAEYTRETAESIPRARELYETVLRLLSTPDFTNSTVSPSASLAISAMQNTPVRTYSTIGERRELQTVTRRTAWKVLTSDPIKQEAMYTAVAGKTAVDAERIARIVSRLPEEPKVSVQRTFKLPNMSERELQALMEADKESPPPEGPFGPRILSLELERASGTDEEVRVEAFSIRPFTTFSTISLGRNNYCIPENPLLSSYRLFAETQLYKIRHCQNMAGMVRDLEPYAIESELSEGSAVLAAVFRTAGTSAGRVSVRATQYRFQTLIERAKELVSIAQQMEAALLSALEKRDRAAYDEIRARQDVELAQARVRLEKLRVQSAWTGIALAEMQQRRSKIQAETLSEWISGGLNDWEWNMINAYEQAGEAEALSVQIQGDLSVMQAHMGFMSSGPLGLFVGLWGTPMNAWQTSELVDARQSAIAAQTKAQIAGVRASFERRKQEWELQRTLAQQDQRIAGLQTTIARRQVSIVQQEQQIAQLQTDHVDTIASFLSNKFTNADLYDWMSSILEGVYSYFLHQATATARLAENQLAFERQEPSAFIIQSDYWETPDETITTRTTESPDRRGLTGSARLLQDIYRLDQHRFHTEKRRNQLTKTFSLSRLAPVELQRFRETGVLAFGTPMVLFDQDYPGHYLRLIKRVRLSIIALTPPTSGIHASLASSGISRVVVGGYRFEKITIRRDPEKIVLSSPINAMGLFELKPDDDMLLPFEGSGVDTLWELQMPKDTNLWDFNTIADVLLTIDYTSLDSPAYYQEVIEQLDNAVSFERAYSFRRDFPDQWYHLHNPSDPTATLQVRFRVDKNAFPPNIGALRIEHLALYFSRKDEIEVEISHLHLLSVDGTPPVGGAATSNAGLVSTRRPNGGSLLPLIGRSPIGEWELALPAAMVSMFNQEQIDDILFVVTYGGNLYQRMQ